MKNFTFNEKEHLYELDGKPLTGITTILGVVGGNKTGALIQWASNKAVAYVEKVLSETIKGQEINWAEVLEQARFAHRKMKEEAGQSGTDIHGIIEGLIKTALSDTGFINENTCHSEKQVQNFISWTVKNKVKFLASEKRLYSEKYFVAGTTDMILEMDGKKYIGDIKTSSGIYDRTPFFQTAGYRMMCEEMGEKDFVGTIIINLKKSGEFNEDNDVYCSNDYQGELDGFLACLTLYRKLQDFEFVKVANNK